MTTLLTPILEQNVGSPGIGDDVEPDAVWKENLRSRIEKELQSMADKVRQDRDASLEDVVEGTREWDDVMYAYRTSMDRVRRIAQEQFNHELKTERLERSLTLGKEIQGEEFEAFRKQQQAIWDIIKKGGAERPQVCRDSTVVPNSNQEIGVPLVPLNVPPRVNGEEDGPHRDSRPSARAPPGAEPRPRDRTQSGGSEHILLGAPGGSYGTRAARSRGNSVFADFDPTVTTTALNDQGSIGRQGSGSLSKTKPPEYWHPSPSPKDNTSRTFIHAAAPSASPVSPNPREGAVNDNGRASLSRAASIRSIERPPPVAADYEPGSSLPRDRFGMGLVEERASSRKGKDPEWSDHQRHPSFTQQTSVHDIYARRPDSRVPLPITPGRLNVGPQSDDQYFPQVSPVNIRYGDDRGGIPIRSSRRSVTSDQGSPENTRYGPPTQAAARQIPNKRSLGDFDTWPVQPSPSIRPVFGPSPPGILTSSSRPIPQPSSIDDEPRRDSSSGVHGSQSPPQAFPFPPEYETPYSTSTRYRQAQTSSPAGRVTRRNSNGSRSVRSRSSRQEFWGPADVSQRPLPTYEEQSVSSDSGSESDYDMGLDRLFNVRGRQELTWKLIREEGRRQDVRRKEEEAKRLEEDARRKQEEAMRREEEAKQKADEARRKEEEVRLKALEIQQKQEELARREAELLRREAEAKFLEERRRREEAEARLQEEIRRREEVEQRRAREEEERALREKERREQEERERLEKEERDRCAQEEREKREKEERERQESIDRERRETETRERREKEEEKREKEESEKRERQRREKERRQREKDEKERLAREEREERQREKEEKMRREREEKERKEEQERRVREQKEREEWQRQQREEEERFAREKQEWEEIRRREAEAAAAAQAQAILEAERLAAEAEARRRQLEEEAQQQREEFRRQQEAAAQRRREEARRQQEAEVQRRRDEEAQRKQELEAQQQRDEETRRRAEEEAEAKRNREAKTRHPEAEVTARTGAAEIAFADGVSEFQDPQFLQKQQAELDRIRMQQEEAVKKRAEAAKKQEEEEARRQTQFMREQGEIYKRLQAEEQGRLREQEARRRAEEIMRKKAELAKQQEDAILADVLRRSEEEHRLQEERRRRQDSVSSMSDSNSNRAGAYHSSSSSSTPRPIPNASSSFHHNPGDRNSAASSSSFSSSASLFSASSGRSNSTGYTSSTSRASATPIPSATPTPIPSTPTAPPSSKAGWRPSPLPATPPSATSRSSTGVYHSAFGGSSSYAQTSPSTTRPTPPQPAVPPLDEEEWTRRQEEHARRQFEQFQREQEAQQRRVEQKAIRQLSKEEVIKLFEEHERRWNRITSMDILTWHSFPWPMLKQPAEPEQLTYVEIQKYILSPHHPGDKTQKERIKDYLRKWHPDRFETKVLPKVREDEREKVKEGAGAVARHLNKLLSSLSVSADNGLFG